MKVLNTTAINLARTGDYQGAKKCIDTALTISPDNIKMLQNSVILFNNYYRDKWNKASVSSEYRNMENYPKGEEHLDHFSSKDLTRLLSQTKDILSMLPQDEPEEIEKWEAIASKLQEIKRLKGPQVILDPRAYEYKRNSDTTLHREPWFSCYIYDNKHRQ